MAPITEDTDPTIQIRREFRESVLLLMFALVPVLAVATLAS